MGQPQAQGASLESFFQALRFDELPQISPPLQISAHAISGDAQGVDPVDLARRVGKYLQDVQQWNADDANLRSREQAQSQAVQQWNAAAAQYNSDAAANNNASAQLQQQQQQLSSDIARHNANPPNQKDAAAVARYNQEATALNQRQSALNSKVDALNAAKAQLDARKQALTNQGADLNAKSSQLQQERQALDQRKQQLDAQGSALRAEQSSRAADLGPKLASSKKYDKHVVRQKEFPEVNSRQEYDNVIRDVVQNPTGVVAARHPDTGATRGVYWQDGKQGLPGTIVVDDPGNLTTGGTAFRPWEGRAYFDKIAHDQRI